jgi:hypothetical protein
MSSWPSLCPLGQSLCSGRSSVGCAWLVAARYGGRRSGRRGCRLAQDRYYSDPVNIYITHFEDMAHVRGATVEFIERRVGSRSHIVCGFPGITLVLKNLLVSRWLLFMAGNVPGGCRKGGWACEGGCRRWIIYWASPSSPEAQAEAGRAKGSWMRGWTSSDEGNIEAPITTAASLQPFIPPHTRQSWAVLLMAPMVPALRSQSSDFVRLDLKS